MKVVNVTLRRSIAAAAVVVAAPLMSSCVSNFNAPTDQVYTPGVGVNDRSGQVDVLHALIVSGADGSGTFIAGLVNQNTGEADALVDVAGVGQAQNVAVDFSGPVEIGPESLVQLADEGGVTVEGEAIRRGAFVEVVLTFQNAEQVTMRVPVVDRVNEFADIPVPSVEPFPEPEDHGGAH